MIDTTYMTAQDKEKVLKQFEKFLQGGLERVAFTKQLYEHLHLHCSFIAHYNIEGFYNTYFNGDKEDFKRFCSNFIQDTGVYDGIGLKAYNIGCYDMEDINIAMGNVLLKYYDKLLTSTTQATRQSAILNIHRLMQDNNLTAEDI